MALLADINADVAAFSDLSMITARAPERIIETKMAVLTRIMVFL